MSLYGDGAKASEEPGIRVVSAVPPPKPPHKSKGQGSPRIQRAEQHAQIQSEINTEPFGDPKKSVEKPTPRVPRALSPLAVSSQVGILLFLLMFRITSLSFLIGANGKVCSQWRFQAHEPYISNLNYTSH